MTGGDAYDFGVDAERETDRLDAVERAFDPVSRCALLEAGVRPAWRCWEVGAGNGSIARWLARTVGADGGVLATDLDARRFNAGDTSVRFARHDAVADPLPTERFDLVHARFLLEHLTDPRRAIARLAECVRPGGVLVLEDSAGLQVQTTPDAPVFGRLAGGWEAAGRAVGWDASYGRRLMSELGDAGLSDLHGYEYRRAASGGADWAHLTAGLERLRGGLVEQGVTLEQLQCAVACLADVDTLITGPPVMVAWGRR